MYIRLTEPDSTPYFPAFNWLEMHSVHWSSRTDLDQHMVTPTRPQISYEIYYI